MESISALVKQRIEVKRKHPTQQLAEEIANELHETQRLGFYLAAVRKIGPERTRQIMSEVRQSNARKPAALFTYLAKKAWTEK